MKLYHVYAGFWSTLVWADDEYEALGFVSKERVHDTYAVNEILLDEKKGKAKTKYLGVYTRDNIKGNAN